ncbi:MAG: glycosyltransferase family 4 protein [Pseudomonadota bacterium]
MKIGYFINQYPKVSHSFVRREIEALERQGVQIERFALRTDTSALVDPGDLAELEKTDRLLETAPLKLISEIAGAVLRSPGASFEALATALKCGRRSDRGLLRHLLYWGEACVLGGRLARAGVDHLHAHFGTNSAMIAMLASSMTGKPFSFTVHGPDEFDMPSFLSMREKIARAAFVVAISSYGRSQLLRWADFQDWRKVKVVHCGIEKAFHATDPAQEGALPSPPEAPRFVCVGRLSEQKGQLILIEALAQVRAAGVDATVVFAGDGDLRVEIENRARALGVGDAIEITGWVSSDRVREEILKARALALPSFAEGLPVVIMEAMVLRRPVLSTYVAGIPELVLNGETGWLAPAGDAGAFAAIMLEASKASPSALLQMGEKARERALDRHDIDTEAAKLSAHFADARSSSVANAPV